MGKEESRCFALILFLIIITASMLPLIGSSNAITPPTRAIYLNDQKIMIRPENRSWAFGYVTGHVIIQASYSDQIGSYYAKLTVDSPFNSSNIPVLEFSPSVSLQHFTFSVMVPFNASREQPHIIIVNGSYGVDPNNLNRTFSPVTCIVYIARYYSWNVECTDRVKVKAGNEKKILLNATNTGNDQDNIRMLIMNLDEFRDRGWKFQFSMVKHYTPAGRSLSVPMIIEVPEDERPGTYEIELTYVSTIAESTGEISHGGNHTLEVQVLNNYRDEVITAMYIALPMTLLLMLAGLMVLFRRRRSTE